MITLNINLKVIIKKTKVHTTGYTSVPSDYRDSFNIEPGDELIWEYTYGDPYLKVYVKKKNLLTLVNLMKL